MKIEKITVSLPVLFKTTLKIHADHSTRSVSGEFITLTKDLFEKHPDTPAGNAKLIAKLKRHASS